MTTQQILAIVFVVVIAVLLLAAFVLYVVKTKNYKVLSQAALKLVTEAEEKFAIEGEKTGTTKYGWVAKQLLKYIPSWLQLFIPAKALEIIIESAVEKLKETLEEAAD